MNKQTLAVIVGSIIIFAIAIVGAMAFTGSGSDGEKGHTMPGGSMMTGTMNDRMMTGMETAP